MLQKRQSKERYEVLHFKFMSNKILTNYTRNVVPAWNKVRSPFLQPSGQYLVVVSPQVSLAQMYWGDSEVFLTFGFAIWFMWENEFIDLLSVIHLSVFILYGHENACTNRKKTTAVYLLQKVKENWRNIGTYYVPWVASDQYFKLCIEESWKITHNP